MKVFLTRHSSRRAGRAIMIISFLTSCVTKVTSMLSERSWALKRTQEDSGLKQKVYKEQLLQIFSAILRRQEKNNNNKKNHS